MSNSYITSIQPANINDKKACESFYEAKISVNTHSGAVTVYGVNADICAKRAVAIVNALNASGVK